MLISRYSHKRAPAEVEAVENMSGIFSFELDDWAIRTLCSIRFISGAVVIGTTWAEDTFATCMAIHRPFWLEHLFQT